MELRALNDFLAIAREENITRAAEQLHVTPPMLSRQSADLEEVPGVKLCYRMTGCMCIWEHPKVCVNHQTDVRYNYSVWRLFLWQEEKTAQKKQQCEK